MYTLHNVLPRMEGASPVATSVVAKPITLGRLELDEPIVLALAVLALFLVGRVAFEFSLKGGG